MGRNLSLVLIVGLMAAMLTGGPVGKGETQPDSMEFFEFLGTFEKDVDPLMLPNMSELKKLPSKPPSKKSLYEKRNTKQEGTRDE